jgi:hypothetical protein
MPETIPISSIFAISGACLSFLGVIIGLFFRKQLVKDKELKEAERENIEKSFDELTKQIDTLWKRHDEDAAKLQVACNQLSRLSGKFDMFYQEHLSIKGSHKMKMDEDGS